MCIDIFQRKTLLYIMPDKEILKTLRKKTSVRGGGDSYDE